MESVSIETTVVSYLVALPARDLVVAAHQQITRDWWDRRRHQSRCVVSQVVVDETSMGDQSEVAKRQILIAPLEVLEITTDVEKLIQAIMESRVLPGKAVRDAAHLAVSAVHCLQFLVTWNCKHLANAQISRRIARVCDEFGCTMPIICTPEELLEDSTDD